MSGHPGATALPSPGPGWRALWAPAAVLAAGAALPLARVLAAPAERLPGTPLGDVYKHAWAFGHALRAPGLHTDQLGAPDGGVLLDVMAAPALLLAPVTAVLGPIVACNLWLWLSFFAVGAATAGLAWEVTRARWPSTWAGVCAQTAPYLLGYPLQSGVHERLTVWVFPLVLLALLRVGRSGSGAWAAAGVAGLGFAVLGCQVYGVFAVVMGLCALPLWWPAANRRHALRLGATLAMMGGVLAGTWLLVRYAAEHPQALSFQPGRTALALGLPSRQPDTASLAELLDPWTAAAQQVEGRGDLLIRTHYLGWALLLPALAGAALGTREVRAVVAAGGLAAVLALGAKVPVGPLVVPDPLFHLLAWVVPTYGRTPPIWQQVGAAGPLLAVGLAALLARLPEARQLGAGALAVAAVLAERALVSPVPLVAEVAPATVSPVYAAIDAPGAVAELPRAWRGSDVAAAAPFLAQATHGQPLVFAINVGSLAADRYRPLLDGRAASWPEAAACLRRGGVRWVVVHRDGFDAPEAAALAEAGLAGAAGAPVAQDADTLLFDLGPPGEAAPQDPPEAGGSAHRARRSDSCPFGRGGRRGG